MDTASALEFYAKFLRAHGYVVIPQERRVILQANYVMPPRAEQLRIGKDRLKDMAQRQQEQTFARKLFDDGLVTSTIVPCSDPVTGHEEVFVSAIAVIRPK